MPCEWKVHEKKEYVRRHDEEERGRRGMIAGGRVAVKALRQESSPGPAACSVQVLTIVALSLPTDFFSLCRNCHSKSEKREKERKQTSCEGQFQSTFTPRDVLVCDKVRVRDSPPSLRSSLEFWHTFRKQSAAGPGHELPESRFLSPDSASLTRLRFPHP